MALFLIRPTTENYEITHTRKFWTHKTPMRKNLGPTKYPREKFLTHEIPTRAQCTMVLDPRWYATHKI